MLIRLTAEELLMLCKMYLETDEQEVVEELSKFATELIKDGLLRSEVLLSKLSDQTGDDFCP